MIRVGIVGAAGYTAGELLRILLLHPGAEVVFAQSSSHAGEPVWTAHEDLAGETDLRFCEEVIPSKGDVMFLCSGHGKSKGFVESLGDSYKGSIIDLSNDFRLKADAGDFIYGLPQVNLSKLYGAKHIANPGCFATAIELSLLPLAAKLPSEVHVTGITGSTGAGQKPSGTSHFSWRTSNLSVYKPFTHQHLGEVTEALVDEGFTGKVNFVPVRGDFARGIIVSTYFDSDLTEEQAVSAYRDFYSCDPFIRVVDFNPDLKMVVGTNRAILYVRKYGDKVHVISMIDNLLKGASGQAVENMNISFGLPRTEGLQFKATRF